MMIIRGATTNFVVSYDNTLTNGPTLADAVLANCEQDMQTLSSLFGGIMPASASLPFQILIVPGSGGASHPGCLATNISCACNASTDPAGLPSLVVAEEAEVFMATQALGFDCGASNGEALSRVSASLLYPTRRWLFSTGNSWMNGGRPDWVDSTEPTDTDFVSIGCGSLFLNYLAYQLNFSWRDIIAAAAPTLAGTATNLGVTSAFTDFAALLETYYPSTSVTHLADDDPFPLGRPSLYLRHNTADDGTSQTGSISNSPDIIFRNSPVATPQATFSTPASIASDSESDADILTGQANYLYLRVWNRGTDATAVTATVYWSPPSTLVTPAMWNLIGSASYTDVPPGNVVEVSDPGVTWPAASIPADGHYCFIATVGNAIEPAPAPGTFATFDDFVNYIYSHNNIAWHNFNVVTLMMKKGGGFSGFLPLPFRITGAWNAPHVFELETIAALPPGSRLALQVPHALGAGLRGADGETKSEELQDRDTDRENPRRLRIAVPPGNSHSLGQVRLDAGAALAAHLLVQIPREHSQKTHMVAIRQMYKGLEVGRITWRIVPQKRGCLSFLG